MKPIKLTLCWIGPFMGTHTIDFTQFNDAGLFLITGKTGAGKSMIFESVVFALYGTGNGRSLRSDHAPDDRESYVCLEFMSGNQIYKIVRYPRQILRSVRNNLIENAEKAEFYQNKTDVFTKLTDVNSRIIEILGIDKSHFTKIAMLPQGEFRKLLTSKSSEKQGIFRKLFNTEKYELLVSQIKAKNEEFEKKYTAKMNAVEARIAVLYTGENTELERLKTTPSCDKKTVVMLAENVLNTLKSETETLRSELENLQKQFSEIGLSEKREYNKNLNGLNDIIMQIETLNQNSNAIENHRKTIVRAVSASHIEGFDKTVGEQEKSLEQSKKNFAKLQQELSVLEQKLGEIKEKLPVANQLKKQQQDLSEKRIKLKNDAQLFTEYNKILIEISEKSKNKSELEFKLEIQDKLEKRSVIKLENDDRKQLIQKITTLQKLIADYQKLLRDYNTKHQKYNKTFADFLQSQAGEIAKNLRPDSPCPVCGSFSHPDPAKISTNAPTQSICNELKKNADDAYLLCTNKFSLIAVELTSEKLQPLNLDPESITDAQMKMVEYLQKLDSEYISTTKKIELISNEILSDIKKVNAKFTKTSQLDQERFWNHDKILEDRRRIEAEMLRIQTLLESSENIRESFKLKLPKNIDNAIEIDDQIREIDEKIKRNSEYIDIIEAEFNRLSNARSSCEGKCSQLEKNIAVQEDNLAENKDQLNAKIFAEGFENYDDYRQSMMEKEQMEFIRKKIVEHDNNLLKLSNEEKSLTKRIADFHDIPVELFDIKCAKLFDLQSIEQFSKEISEQLEKKQIQFAANNLRIKETSDIIETVRMYVLESEDIERKSAAMKRIYNVANGKNLKGISLECYIQMEFFAKITAAASNILSEMTNGQYLIQYKEEKAKNGAASGLDFSIFDLSTGKNRDVTTLSGGETFMASLALALALANVVSGYAGGIQTGIMFIDEGFGSLDDQTLDTVLSVLSNLRSGSKLIGVISHVAEMKERINAQISVTPLSNGSKIDIRG